MKKNLCISESIFHKKTQHHTKTKKIQTVASSKELWTMLFKRRQTWDNFLWMLSFSQVQNCSVIVSRESLSRKKYWSYSAAAKWVQLNYSCWRVDEYFWKLCSTMREKSQPELLRVKTKTVGVDRHFVSKAQKLKRNPIQECPRERKSNWLVFLKCQILACTILSALSHL